MLFKRLELKNLLSFRDTKVDLRPLNVLIGPNASGKSNLIDVISLLRAAPTSLSNAIREGGGARSWLSKADGAGAVAAVVCDIELESSPSLRYKLAFYGAGFKESALPSNPNVENIAKAKVLMGIKRATWKTKTGEYHKTGHAPGLLQSINPLKVRKAAPNCARLFQAVLAKIGGI